MGEPAVVSCTLSASAPFSSPQNCHKARERASGKVDRSTARRGCLLHHPSNTSPPTFPSSSKLHPQPQTKINYFFNLEDLTCRPAPSMSLPVPSQVLVLLLLPHSSSFFLFSSYSCSSRHNLIKPRLASNFWRSQG